MKSKTKYLLELNNELDKVINENQGADLVENRYRTMRLTLAKTYPNLIKTTDKEVMLQFLHDVVHLDRKLRRKTEGKQKLLKTILSQEKQIQLGYVN